jgi:hypothetical protein
MMLSLLCLRQYDVFWAAIPVVYYSITLPTVRGQHASKKLLAQNTTCQAKSNVSALLWFAEVFVCWGRGLVSVASKWHP